MVACVASHPEDVWRAVLSHCSLKEARNLKMTCQIFARLVKEARLAQIFDPVQLLRFFVRDGGAYSIRDEEKLRFALANFQPKIVMKGLMRSSLHIREKGQTEWKAVGGYESAPQCEHCRDKPGHIAISRPFIFLPSGDFDDFPVVLDIVVKGYAYGDNSGVTPDPAAGCTCDLCIEGFGTNKPAVRLLSESRRCVIAGKHDSCGRRSLRNRENSFECPSFPHQNRYQWYNRPGGYICEIGEIHKTKMAAAFPVEHVCTAGRSQRILVERVEYFESHIRRECPSSQAASIVVLSVPGHVFISSIECSLQFPPSDAVERARRWNCHLRSLQN